LSEHPSAREALRLLASRLAETGWRGLALAHHRSHTLAAVEALEAVGAEPASCIGVADRAARRSLGGYCSRLVSPARYQEILGGESRVALVAVDGLLRPNILAAAAETVVAGGLLLIAAGPRGSWNPAPPGGRGVYRGYLASSLERSRSHAWVDLEAGETLSLRLPEGRPPPRAPPRPGGARGLPARLASMAATEDQLRGLVEASRALRGRARTILILGDRGRGKSFLLGLTLAYAVWARQAGRVHVVAPHPAGLQSLFRGLLGGLDSLGLGSVARRRLEGGHVVRVWGPWFSVFYQPPDAAEPAPLLVVDEAASIGVARVRRLSWRSGRLLAASTVHGYEGSGRALIHLLERDLPRPLVRLELSEPIRYHAGDPLEEWVLSTFHLDAEPPTLGEAEARASRCVRIDPPTLAGELGLLRHLMGILAQAHYRFEPDYILALLESPNHEVYALQAGDAPVAAADMAVEEPGLEEAARLGTRLLSIHSPRAGEALAVRVVRIAVAPSLQRRGLGTKLLRCLEERARSLGADVALALFSRHEVLPFWARAGYLVAYISPRYNRATGEKNILVARGLTGRGRSVVEEASSAFRVRFLLSLQSIYRDVAAERVPLILDSTSPASSVPLRLSADMERRLRLFLGGSIDLEQAMDAVWLLAFSCLAQRAPSSLGFSGREAVALAARILQGKPLNEVAYTLGSSIEEAREASVEAARRLAEACGWRA
jgi:tRNA(Met) cytidine acetyltransferase